MNNETNDPNQLIKAVERAYNALCFASIVTGLAILCLVLSSCSIYHEREPGGGSTTIAALGGQHSTQGYQGDLNKSFSDAMSAAKFGAGVVGVTSVAKTAGKFLTARDDNNLTGDIAAGNNATSVELDENVTERLKIQRQYDLKVLEATKPTE